MSIARRNRRTGFGSRFLPLLCALIAACFLQPGPAAVEARHGIAMHGEPALPANFDHLPYVNPNAPRGGRLRWGVTGTFDSLNPLIVKGNPVPSVRYLVVESLLARSMDEPFTLYGLLAQTVETDPARTYVTFNLDPRARFSDGAPVTPEDVIFSWEILRDKGRFNLRTYYSKVKKVEAVGERGVRFELPGDDRELPLILGLMPVIAKHAINPDTFDETSFKAPLGTGPYRVGKVDPGKMVSFERDPDYWGRDLAVNRGLWNFDEIRFEFFLDANAHHEAFKADQFDLRVEQNPARWQTGYDFPAARAGRVVKELFPLGTPTANYYYVFNTRRPIFADIRVREALGLLFDFEWINRNLFFGLYRRTASYYDGSELSAYKKPADERERMLLAPFMNEVRADVLDGTWSPPVSDGSGRDRRTLRQALALFAAAGYTLRGTTLVDSRTGRPFTFEILVVSDEDKRLAVNYVDSLKRAGIAASVRLVDASQYIQRLGSYDFDMIQVRWDQSLSPGNEQAFYWSSPAADTNNTRNYMGVKSPAVDAMIAAMLRVEGREDFVAAVRALDRVLISGSYSVPLFHPPGQWVARWTRIAHPEKSALMGYVWESWWYEPK